MEMKDQEPMIQEEFESNLLFEAHLLEYPLFSTLPSWCLPKWNKNMRGKKILAPSPSISSIHLCCSSSEVSTGRGYLGVDGGLWIELLLLSSFPTLPEWILLFKGENSICFPSSSSSSSRMVYGTYGEGELFFFNFLLLTPIIVVSILALLRTNREASSFEVLWGITHFSSGASTSCLSSWAFSTSSSSSWASTTCASVA